MNTLYAIRLLEVSISVLTATMTSDGGGGGWGTDGDDGNEAPVSLKKEIIIIDLYADWNPIHILQNTRHNDLPARRFHVTIAAVAVCRFITIYVARFMLASSTSYKSYNVSADF